MKLVEWLHATTRKWRDQRHRTPLRQGQFYMNELHAVRPDLYVRITGSDHDPFYVDERFPKFVLNLRNIW